MAHSVAYPHRAVVFGRYSVTAVMATACIKAKVVFSWPANNQNQADLKRLGFCREGWLHPKLRQAAYFVALGR